MYVMKNPLFCLLILYPRLLNCRRGIVLPIRLCTNFVRDGRKNTTVALHEGRTIGIADVEVVCSVLKLQQ